MVSFTKKKKVNAIAQNFVLDYSVSKAFQQSRIANENKPIIRDMFGEELSKAYLQLKAANNNFIKQADAYFNTNERTKVFVDGPFNMTDEMACRILELIEQELIQTKQL